MRVPLYSLVLSLSKAADLINSAVVNHHYQVAHIALNISKIMGFSEKEQKDIALASVLHDIGALSLKERLEALKFEVTNPYQHAELGYRLLKEFDPFNNIATIIRFHHVRWMHSKGEKFMGNDVPIESHVVHLSDRVAVLVANLEDDNVLSHVEEIREKIVEKSGNMFVPDVVDAFMEVSKKESFWLDVISPDIYRIFEKELEFEVMELDIQQLEKLTLLFARIIDFRSRFTATHSSGVAASASALSELVGFSDVDVRLMRIAGYLHDLGKLAVPVEILDKPGRLTKDEFDVIKTHTYYTYRILEHIEELDVINRWASFHHERLDGNGYPFKLGADDLDIGARIMAVADVFTAVTEDRPYRKGMDQENALLVLKNMADTGGIDRELVLLLENNYDMIDNVRKKAQAESIKIYEELLSDIKLM